MGFSIKFVTAESGRSIVYIEGLQDIISKEIVNNPLKIDFIFANSADPLVLHFIWVFTVTHSPCLRVSSPQRVKQAEMAHYSLPICAVFGAHTPKD